MSGFPKEACQYDNVMPHTEHTSELTIEISDHLLQDVMDAPTDPATIQLRPMGSELDGFRLVPVFTTVVSAEQERARILAALEAMCECEPGDDEPACFVCKLIMEAL